MKIDLKEQNSSSSSYSTAAIATVTSYGFLLLAYHWVMKYHTIIKIHFISNNIMSNLLKSNQIKSNQINSNQIKLHHIRSNQIKSNQITSHHITSHQIISNHVRSHHAAQYWLSCRVTAYPHCNLSRNSILVSPAPTHTFRHEHAHTHSSLMAVKGTMRKRIVPYSEEIRGVEWRGRGSDQDEEHNKGR